MKYSPLCLGFSIVSLGFFTVTAQAAEEDLFLKQIRTSTEQTIGQGHSAIWTLPLVATQYQPVKPTPAMQAALQAQNEARFLDALIALEHEEKNVQAGTETEAELNLLHASFLLQGNQSRQAITLLAPLQTSKIYAPNAYALTAMAYLQLGQLPQAQASAQPVPESEPVLLAKLTQTYVLQGLGHLAEARKVIHDFNARTPQSAIALAREAELALTLNQTAAADNLVNQAKQVDTTHPYVIAVSGLAYLIDGKVQQAKDAFETALKRDPKDAKALFGLGLAEIKLSDLQAGVKNLQAANESDPSNALILTYLGRVQQQLGQSDAAKESWRSAAQADPKDPVPYLYQAQAALQANQPLQARESLREAQARTANRAVYRGESLLKEDKEILQANLAEVQRQLGLDSLAFQTLSDTSGEKSSANLRNQADVLQGQRFAESARRSLLLQSLFNDKPGNMLSSLDVYGDGAGQTGATVPQHGVVSDLSPQQASYNNYDSLFNQRATLAADATTGSQNTNGEQVRLGVGNDTLGISLAGLQFKTDGFDYQNTDYAIPQGLLHQNLDNSVAQGVLQWRPTQATQAFVSYQTFVSNRGEIYAPADPINNGVYNQLQDTSGIVRVGLRQTLDDSSELRGIYSHQQTGQTENKEWLSDFLPTTNLFYTGPLGSNTFLFNNSSEASSGEVQYRRSGTDYTTQWGVSSTRALLAIQDHGDPPMTKIAHQVYVDWQQSLNPYWQLEAGLVWGEYDYIHNAGGTDVSTYEHDWLPKLGLIYTPDNATHVRLAAWKGMDSAAVGDASLAAATLAGIPLNRTSDTNNLVQGVALGADTQLGAAWLLEGHAQRRWTETPFNNGNGVQQLASQMHIDESRLALHWQPDSQPVNVTVAYDDEHYQSDDATYFTPNSVQEQHLRSTQLALRWFVSAQLTANFGLSHNQLDAIQQFSSCDPVTFTCGPVPVPFDVALSSNMADASVNWKFNRHGSVDAGVRNATNTGILYTELDPLIPRFSQGRLVYAKAKLSW
jgi:tetratricopeptide (TPR) repeat protein